MGNTYSGGEEYYDDKKTKHFIRKLLKSGGILKEEEWKTQVRHRPVRNQQVRHQQGTSAWGPEQNNWRDSKSDAHSSDNQNSGPYAHLSNKGIDIEAHTKVNCTPTEDIKNYDIKQYTQQSCRKLLIKFGWSNNAYNVHNFDNFMFSLYNREKKKKGQWGEGGMDHINKEIKDHISTVTNLPAGGTHLDYGCGGGKTSQDIIELCKVNKSYCVDVKNNMIEEMKTLEDDGKVIFVENDNIHTIRDHKEIKDGTVDIITAMQTFHHNNFKNATEYIMFEERIRYVIETLINKLKPGGYLLIREHNVENDNEAYPIMLKHLLHNMTEITNTRLGIYNVKRITRNYHTDINYKAWYMSYKYLHDIIIGFDMELVISRYNYDKPYDHQRIYNSLYKKKEPLSIPTMVYNLLFQ